MAISPFSLENDWTVFWKRIPSNFKERPILGEVAKDEQEALEGVASVGLISATQLLEIYSLGRGKVKRMVDRNRLVQHQIVMNKKNRITIYSLGVNGAKIVGVNGYEHNYWVEYKTTDILKRLLFFSFYKRVYPNDLLVAPKPFIGSIMINNNPMHVYVIRGSTNDLMMYLKWNTFNERLILITESLSYLEQLKPFLYDLRLRVILDENVVDHSESLSNSFYFLEGDEFKKEKLA